MGQSVRDLFRASRALACNPYVMTRGAASTKVLASDADNMLVIEL